MIGPDAQLPEFPAHVAKDEAGIYRWDIEGVGCYVGKAKQLRRRWSEYRNNVAKIIDGRPYRKSKSGSFRRIHVALAQACVDLRAIRFTIIETNLPGPALLERERYWIATLSPGLNGRGAADQGELL